MMDQRLDKSPAWATRGIRPALLLGLAVLVAWPLVFSSAYDIRILTIAGIYALIVLGYQFIFGHAGALALTQGTFFGVGAYVTAILSTKLGYDAEATLLLSAIGPVLLAAIVAAPVLRLESHYFALATLGIGQVLLLIAIGWEPMTGGSNGISGVPGLVLFGFAVPKGMGMLLAVWTCVAVAAALSWQLTRGLFGAAFHVMRDNDLAATSIGVDIGQLRFVAFLLSAAFAGVAGALYAHTIRVVSPEVLEFPVMVACLTMAVVGGRTHIAGAILGAVLLIHLPEWFRSMERYYLIAYGAVLLAMIIIAPHGLIGLLQRVRAKWAPERARAPAASALPQQRASQDKQGDTLLSVRGVTKSFGGVHALRDVSFDLHRGEILGLIGPNGAGKTTLINIITSIYKADAGAVILGDVDLVGKRGFDVARMGVARTFQNINLIDEMTVLDNVAVARFGRERASARQALTMPPNDPVWQRARSHAMALLDAVGLTELAAQPCGGLAYGLKRRVEIARALALEPQILLLDEPAAGLNESEQADLAERLLAFARNGLSLLVIEHNMPFLMPLAHRMVCLDYGEVIATGTPAEIRADRRVVEAYLGAPEEEA